MLSLFFPPSPISQVVINGSLHHAAAGGLVSVFVRTTLVCWDEHATASDLCHSPGCHFLQGVWQQWKSQGQGPGQTGVCPLRCRVQVCSSTFSRLYSALIVGRVMLTFVLSRRPYKHMLVFIALLQVFFNFAVCEITDQGVDCVDLLCKAVLTCSLLSNLSCVKGSSWARGSHTIRRGGGGEGMGWRQLGSSKRTRAAWLSKTQVCEGSKKTCSWYKVHVDFCSKAHWTKSLR